MDVEGNDKITFTTTRGLGDFALIIDGRNATVKYVDLDVEKTYDATAVLVENLPTAEKEGHIFKGWKIEDKDDIYTGIITDEMMDLFHELAYEGHELVYAYAVFEAEPVDENPGTDIEDKNEEKGEKVPEGVQEEHVMQHTITTIPPATGDVSKIYINIFSIVMSIVLILFEKSYKKH